MPTPLRLRSLRTLTALALLAAHLGVGSRAMAEDVLLLPDSMGNKIWALSPVDGTVLTENFIPADGRLSQPIQIIPSGSGTLLVTDEVADAVFEYSAQGLYLRTLAGPADGVDGAYGICVKDGFAYFTTGSNKKIFRVALDGATPATLFADWTTIGDPRGIQPYGDGFLVGNSGNDNLEIMSATGVVAPVPFHDSDGLTGIDFPQQIQPLSKGRWMVCGFSRPSGIFFYDEEGFEYTSLQNELVTLPRGASVLDNGEILYAGGTRLVRLNPTTLASVDIVNELGRSFRWINRFTLPAPCVGDITGDGSVNASDLALLLGTWGTNAPATDLDGDGVVSAADLSILLGAWGACP